MVSQFPDSTRRQIVSDAINTINNDIITFASQNGIAVFDSAAFASALIPKIDQNGYMNLAGELIDFFNDSDEPHHFILADHNHLGTVTGGLLANAHIELLNTFGLGIAIFSDEEMLINAGIDLQQSDITAPDVSITYPANGAQVVGMLSVDATASDNVAVAGVQFKLDGVNLGIEDTVSPFSTTWNTTQATNGTHILTAVARDAAGNTAISTAVTITVNNPVPDTTPPAVSISSPAYFATVSGTVTVSANASDNVAVTGVQFRLDGVNLGTEDTVSPFSTTWNTTQTTNGRHTLTAVARDAAGNTRTSSSRIVTVNNPIPDTTPPTVSISSPLNNATVAGSVAVSAAASDNVAVTGVQFRLDGVNLGIEDTVSPFSTTWNTTQAINGAHTLTAVARDASGILHLRPP